MKSRVLILGMLIGLVSCSGEPDKVTRELTTEAVCAGGVGEFDVYVERDLSSIGPSGNDVQITEEAVWIVESGSNSVSRFDRQRERFESDFIYVGSDRNPYAALVVDDEVWIANYLANSVSIADQKSGEITIEIEDERLRRPSGFALGSSHIYVGNVNYLSRREGFGEGSVAVIDRQTKAVVGSFSTEFKNPQFLAVEEIEGEEMLFVSSGGAFDMTQDVVRVEGEGGLEIFAINEDPIAPSGKTFALGQAEVELVGAPGRPLFTPDKRRIYLVSANAGAIFAFDVVEKRWIYDAAKPLWIYESAGDATHRAVMDQDGLLWITAFNKDGLYLLDTTCDELIAPLIDLGRVENMLEGPQAIEVTQEGADRVGYFIYSIANGLGRVRMAPADEK